MTPYLLVPVRSFFSNPPPLNTILQEAKIFNLFSPLNYSTLTNVHFTPLRFTSHSAPLPYKRNEDKRKVDAAMLSRQWNEQKTIGIMHNTHTRPTR